VVFLGDIFDLLRTTYWLDDSIPEDDTPWGADESAIEWHANKAFQALAGHPRNQESFKEIKKGLKRLKSDCPSLETEPRLFYIPGNHDRLCNKWKSLRQQVCDCLGILKRWHNPDRPFYHDFPDTRYGVYARHGQEFDHYNYEGTSAFLPQDDYQAIPIGDPITTELIARLPLELSRRLDPLPWLTPEDKAQLKRNFQEVDNVRPFAAVIEWLLYQVRVQGERDARLKDLIEDTVDAVIRRFNALNFVQAWYDRHDKWLNPFDRADKIQAVLYLLENFKIFPQDHLLSLAMKAMEFFQQDDLREAAPQEAVLIDPAFRYVVYGHTHEPLVVPLRIRKGNEQLYLNTGTWRTRYVKAERDGSFISWHNLTYLIFYREDERPNREAHFETWTGTLKYV
jgi:UDP-2,3-diacylglucosamine pyrophosphatase LpxH